MPSLYLIYCYSRYRFTRYFDNGKTCFDCDYLKFHRYNRYILTTGHFIADTDCIIMGEDMTCDYISLMEKKKEQRDAKPGFEPLQVVSGSRN